MTTVCLYSYPGCLQPKDKAPEGEVVSHSCCSACLPRVRAEMGLAAKPVLRAAVVSLFLVALAAGSASPAHAGRLESYSMWCGAKAADIVTTEMALGNGARELNPLMQKQSVRFGAGALVCVGASEGDHLLRRHKKLRWTVRILGVGFMSYAAIRNAGHAR